MKYALWNLKQDEPNYLSGPESKILELGGHAEASWANGQVENGATILGYITGTFNTESLSPWNYREVTQVEALEFCRAINLEAYLLENGKFGAPKEDFTY